MKISTWLLLVCTLWLAFAFPGVASTQTPPGILLDSLRADSLLKLCLALNDQEELDQAYQKAQEALAIYVAIYGEEDVKTAEIRMRFVAYGAWAARHNEEAYALFQHSLHTYELVRDTPSIAAAHEFLSRCWRSQRRYEEAAQETKIAIDLLNLDSARYAVKLISLKVALAFVFNEGSNHLAALPLLQGAKAEYIRRNQFNALGVLSYHLGETYYGLHDFARAKENYLAALEYLKKQLPADHSYFGDLAVLVGSCYQRLGDYDTGLQYLLQAKTLYQKRFLPNDPHYLGFLQSFGEFYLEAEIYPAAIIQLDSCLFLKERKFGVRSYYLLGTLRTLGAAYAGSKQFAKATICYRRGLQIAVDSMGNNHQKAALFYSELAAVQLAQGDFRSSLVLCDTAFAFLGFDPEHPEKAVPRDFFRELCQRTANALVQQYQQQGDLAALYRADHYFTLAAETLHREIEEVMVNSSREILYDRDHVGLEQGLDTRMLLFDATRDPQYLEASFQIASQGKAFLLSESMRQNGALRYAGVPDSILQAEWSLREKILEAEKKLEKSPSYAGKTAALPLNSDLYDWRAAYETLLGRIETNYPAYFHLRQLRRELSSRELRRKWLAPGQSLLMYSLTAEHTYAFVVTRDTFCCVALPSDVSLPTTVESLRSSLTAYYTASQPDDALYDRSMATYLASAQSLYRYLVAPVAQFLSGRVVIIPDGVLCYLPFEALLTGAPADPGNFRSYPFWIRQTAISYALSTDYLVETTLPPPAKPKKTWLGVAPFSGDRSIGDTTTLVSRNEHFSALPFSGKEVTDIANLVQGEAWLGAAATPGRFEKEAFRYRILHLATHSRVDDRSGDYSYMATASTGDPLFARDLYLLTISAEMVVLSSCEAGGGKLLHGEGIIGMVRAFTFAGARSVVAPLWATNDQSNAGLMVSFYRNLQKGQPKDRALQQACLNLLDHTPTESHPFFWAGFRVFGQVNPLWK